MKINTTILVAALGFASASLASAQQFVFLTGSTAARDAAYNTIMNGTQGGFDATPAFIGYGNSVAGNCSYMEFYGKVSGVDTILTCHWSGSEAGIADVSGSATEAFVEDAIGSFPAAGTANAVAHSSNPTTTVNHTVDFAQADNNKTYSYTPTSTATFVDDATVVPFVFVKSTTTIANQASFTDINADNFKALASGGAPLSLFTGNQADTKWVYLSGRDHFSGTRANTFGVTTWGIKNSPSQVYLDANGNMITDPNTGTFPFTTEGQSSGGTLAKSMTNTTASVDQVNGGTGFIAVTYLGLPDDATAEGTPYNATRLTFNGVAESTANVQNGLYKFWGYEFTAKRSGISTLANGMATALAAHLQSNASGFQIAKSTMNVSRSGPTGYVYHN